MNAVEISKLPDQGFTAVMLTSFEGYLLAIQEGVPWILILKFV